VLRKSHAGNFVKSLSLKFFSEVTSCFIIFNWWQKEQSKIWIYFVLLQVMLTLLLKENLYVIVRTMWVVDRFPNWQIDQLTTEWSLPPSYVQNVSFLLLQMIAKFPATKMDQRWKHLISKPCPNKICGLGPRAGIAKRYNVCSFKCCINDLQPLSESSNCCIGKRQYTSGFSLSPNASVTKPNNNEMSVLFTVYRQQFFMFFNCITRFS